MRQEEKSVPLQFLYDEKVQADTTTCVRERLQNMDWFNDHATEISTQYKGKYIAVVDDTLFAADSRKGAYDMARAHDPTKQPFIVYIPVKARKMIYDR